MARLERGAGSPLNFFTNTKPLGLSSALYRSFRISSFRLSRAEGVTAIVSFLGWSDPEKPSPAEEKHTSSTSQIPVQPFRPKPRWKPEKRWMADCLSGTKVSPTP